MRSVKGLIGKAIISVESGDRLGSISDALMDDATVSLVGLVISGGVLGREHVVPFRDVQTLGGDAVLVRSASGVLGAREWRDAGGAATRSSTLKGRPVVTATGHRLGEVSDQLVDEQTGAFGALEVATADFGGLRTRHSQVRAGANIKIGPDAIVVPDGSTDADQVEPTGGPRETADR